ncbi:MAG: hypothetical protein K0R99_13 [Microbacterium sp.]|nr:hypothetical protein [Microbacterium sp.]
MSLAAVAVATVCLVVPVATTATAADAVPAPDYLIPYDGNIPAELAEAGPVPEKFQTPGNADQRVLQLLAQAQVEHPELGVAGTEWDAENQRTLLYATASSADVAAVLSQYGLTDDVEHREAAYSREEMTTQIESLIGDEGILPSGQAVVSAAPALDGSSIELTIDEEYESSRMALTVPDVGPDVHINYGEPYVASVRDHTPGTTSTTSMRYSGALMQSGYGCTTGFRGARVSDSRPAMLSADHCQLAPNSGPGWYYGSSTAHPLGVEQGTVVPPTGRPDMASWTGTGIFEMVPGILIGSHVVPGVTVHPIKGAVTTSVGSRVCYSGAFSGTMCGNIVTGVGLTVCYGAPVGCYNNLTVTKHEFGTSAAGQGDSGGPAYVSTGAGIYGAGFISGIRNTGQACTGDTGRQCSSEVLYAPIIDLFDSGFGISIIP